MATHSLRAGVLLFPQVEVLDFAGPFEVLGRATDETGLPCFSVLTLGPTPEVLCVDGLVVRPHFTLEAAPELDILVVPGGPGAREPQRLEPVLSFIKARAAQVQVMASVCTGSYWLARAGLLDGQSATTHTLRLDDFAAAFPSIKVVRQKIVEQERIITAGGVASGVDLGLHLVERFFGEKARRREAVRLDGPWK
ncbi:MAG: DJ-1/PfpI family protein [Desulfarculus sp.]|nr:DJ-1/PfpI family protein [Pseudomonadota bacterium]MBV1717755.1 DJ-1/PfpI family protein [Desulfarculus sp.]MBU4575535.1 DJ-1/PfpI family protein [Pseudomonadota bacterium]MBU4596752.1 DJ-1/PfpI family protein [Pseudomonadota bacterium]MBV1740479.1 DJ-1/PfpI family protein [Desulfarculus sp.]